MFSLQVLLQLCFHILVSSKAREILIFLCISTFSFILKEDNVADGNSYQ
jgi:hypothetical protein